MGRSPGLPVEIESDDIGELIEQYRDVYPISEHFVTFDPPMHAMHRGLMMRLMTPKRLEENEAFMWALSDRLIDAFAADGACEFTKAYADPFALLNIADLLGVPEQDHAMLRTQFESYTAGALDREGRRGAVRVPRRRVRRLRRGPAPITARRRDDQARAGDVPRRVDARGDRRRAHRRVPVRRPGRARPRT